MFKQLVIVSVLLVGLSLADPIPAQQEEAKLEESALNKLHGSLFYVQADAQEPAQTLEQLKLAKGLLESEGNPEMLFFGEGYNLDHLIELYSTEETCNPRQSNRISGLIDYHRTHHGMSNVVEYLNMARRYQLASCQVQDIQSKLGKTIGDLANELKLELPSVVKFVDRLNAEQREKVMTNDLLPTGEVAQLVAEYMNYSRKAPRFMVRVINDKHIKSAVDSTVSLLERISRAYQRDFGLFSEVSKDAFVWRKLGADEQNKILVGRFCNLAEKATNPISEVDLRHEVDIRL